VKQLANFLLAAVFLVGLYCPTSIDTVQSKWLWAAPGVFAIAVFVTVILRYGLHAAPLVCAIGAMSSLLFFTAITPLWILTPGALLPYTALLLLICTDLSGVAYGWPLRFAWIGANILNILLAALIVADYAPVKTFFISTYSAFYDRLVSNMLAAGKPVLMFASHSIAAFFFFVCFYLHLRTFTARRSNGSLVMAMVYLLLLVLLKSISAYCLFVAGVALLFYHTAGPRTVMILSAGVVAICVTTAWVNTAKWNETMASVEQVWNDSGSGFQGRYLENGVLNQDLKYLNEHPLQGVGIGYSESLWYGDSGPIELLIRGSIPLLLAVYIGFWTFVRNSLISKGMAIAVFLMYFSFEIAYSNLLYLRTVCVLPFVIVYLNGLGRRHAFQIEEAHSPAVLRAPASAPTLGAYL
jgi:hypothetical protein